MNFSSSSNFENLSLNGQLSVQELYVTPEAADAGIRDMVAAVKVFDHWYKRDGDVTPEMMAARGWKYHAAKVWYNAVAPHVATAYAEQAREAMNRGDCVALINIAVKAMKLAETAGTKEAVSAWKVVHHCAHREVVSRGAVEDAIAALCH